MLSIYSWFGYELPMAERFRLIRAAGFDAVLLWWSDAQGQINGCPEYRRQPETARAAGLAIENIHAPLEGCNAWWADGINGDAWLARMLGCVEDCAAMAIPAMVVHLTDGTPPPPNAAGLSRILRLAEVAERLGVNVALENLRPSPHLAHVLERVDAPRIGFCYDSGHHRKHEPEADLLGMYGHRLMALHLHDNDGAEDKHWLPFDGVTDWADVMRRIAATGYAGATALEVMAWREEAAAMAPRDFLAAAHERAERLARMRGVM